MGTDGSGRATTGLGPVAAVAVLVFGLGAMLETAQQTVAYGLRPMYLFSEAALVAPALLLLLALRRPLAASLGLSRLEPRVALRSLGLGATLWAASVGLMELQALVWPPKPEYLELFRRILETLRPRGPLDALVSVAAIAIVPAACEEALLRGTVLPPLARVLGRPAGVLASALLFAAIHLDAYRFLFTFAVGIVLGILRLRVGSLTAPILTHAMLNTITFTAAPFVDDTPGDEAASPLLAVALLVVGTALSVALIRSLRARDENG
jgi:membrane protease YdiL (CAAX protease family)